VKYWLLSPWPMFPKVSCGSAQGVPPSAPLEPLLDPVPLLDPLELPLPLELPPPEPLLDPDPEPPLDEEVLSAPPPSAGPPPFESEKQPPSAAKHRRPHASLASSPPVVPARRASMQSSTVSFRTGRGSPSRPIVGTRPDDIRPSWKTLATTHRARTRGGRDPYASAPPSAGKAR
jgi:hypothetical protein